MSNSNSNSNSNTLPPAYTPPLEIPPPLDNSGTKFSNTIGIPDHEIVAIKRSFLSKRHDTFCIREGFSSFNNHVILVIDSEGKEVYTCKEKMTQVVLYDIDKTPILNACTSGLKYKEIFIYEGKKKESTPFAVMKTENDINNDIYVYKVHFLNKTTKVEEVIEARYDGFSKVYGVYINPKQPNETMICSIWRKNKVSVNYEIEIAPMVDYMFMLSIATAFMRIESIKRIRNVAGFKKPPGLLNMYI